MYFTQFIIPVLGLVVDFAYLIVCTIKLIISSQKKAKKKHTDSSRNKSKKTTK